MRGLQDDKFVELTPCGPRGPERCAAVGPVALAQITGKPIVPFCWAARRHWPASGWDRMFVPKPFSSGRFVIGAPLYVGRGDGRAADQQILETARRQLDATLNDLGDQASALATGQIWPSVSSAKEPIIPGRPYQNEPTETRVCSYQGQTAKHQDTPRCEKTGKCHQGAPSQAWRYQIYKLSDGL